MLSLGSAIPASLPAGRSYYTYVPAGLALHVMLMKPEFVKYPLIPLEEDCFKKKGHNINKSSRLYALKNLCEKFVVTKT